MPDRTEHEYRGWEIRITDTIVDRESSALIEVWRPGHDPHTHTPEIMSFLKTAASPPEVQRTALQDIEKWIDRKVRQS